MAFVSSQMKLSRKEATILYVTIASVALIAICYVSRSGGNGMEDMVKAMSSETQAKISTTIVNNGVNEHFTGSRNDLGSALKRKESNKANKPKKENKSVSNENGSEPIGAVNKILAELEDDDAEEIDEISSDTEVEDMINQMALGSDNMGIALELHEDDKEDGEDDASDEVNTPGPFEPANNPRPISVVPAGVASVAATFNHEHLFRFMETDNIDSFRQAISSSTNSDEIWDDRGFNLLHRAASKSKIDFITLIIEMSAQIFPDEKTRDGRGCTVIHLAVEGGEKDFDKVKRCLEKLIENGSNVNEKTGVLGYSPLYTAIVSNNARLVEFLLSQDADVNAEYDGYPMLHYAINHRSIDIVRMLLKAGADPKVANKFNRMTVHETAFLGKTTILTELIRLKSVNVNELTPKNPSGPDRSEKSKAELKSNPILYEATALHYAARNGDISTVLALKRAGASIKLKDSCGKKAKFYEKHYVLDINF